MRRLICVVLCALLAAGLACGDDGQDDGSGATGAMCGGFAGLACPDTHVCDFPAESCGMADMAGVCQPRPDGCDDNFEPVCGCDGKVHSNECEARAAGTDVAIAGGCQAPQGSFACGAGFCDLATSYCRRVGSDVAGVPDEHTCTALPGACQDPATCACLASETCGDRCEAGAGGGLTLTCPGG